MQISCIAIASRALAALMVAAALAGCSPPAPEGKGTLEIHIKDHRAAIDDFKNLDIPIEGIRIKPSGSWIEALASLPDIDLTAYRSGNAVAVYKNETAAGAYEGLHLKLGEISGRLKKGDRRVAVKNKIVPVQMNFEIVPGAVTLLVLDLKVVDMSDHPGQGYELHLNAFEHSRDGKLIERVPPG